MKIVQNNVKCGEVIIFDHKFYLKTAKFLPNFVPMVRILSKKFVPRVQFFNKKYSGLGGGMVTSQDDTCITCLAIEISPLAIDDMHSSCGAREDLPVFNPFRH